MSGRFLTRIFLRACNASIFGWWRRGVQTRKKENSAMKFQRSLIQIAE
jgi:hypothetical protein